MRRGGCVLAASVAVALAACSVAAEAPPVRTFRAGAYAMDVSPTGFPVIVNGNFFAQTATETQDTLHVRWLVLDDGATRLALGVLDTCLIPANFAMHYFGSTALSADYGGVFADKLGPLLGATNAAPAFVGMMSQGTSGDQHWMDYSRPAAAVTRELYAEQLAQRAADAYKAIRFQAWVPLAMRQATLRLATRQPDDKRLAWAREIVAKKGDRLSKDWAEVYACEQLWLKENPVRDMKLQALRVGDLGIAAWPCEVFALHGLQVKAQSPFQPTMNIALANAEEGYILPPELYPLGGYNTWACRTAMLETDAGPQDGGGVDGAAGGGWRNGKAKCRCLARALRAGRARLAPAGVLAHGGVGRRDRTRRDRVRPERGLRAGDRALAGRPGFTRVFRNRQRQPLRPSGRRPDRGGAEGAGRTLLGRAVVLERRPE